MINEFNVKGLYQERNCKLGFGPNMNLLVGPNGSTKTTLLNLLWCLTSGNLHRIIKIPFNSVEIKTSWFDLSVEQTGAQATIESKFKDGSEESKSVDLAAKNLGGDLGELNERIANVVPGSLFFPTFRRNEGGSIYTAEPAYETLRNAMLEFSEALSVKDQSGESRHKFITAVSTEDIGKLLIEKNKRLEHLKEQQNVDTLAEKDEESKLSHQFSRLRDVVKDFYEGYGEISIPGSISLHGKGSLDISSEALSSGEKQFLGFLCHNAFSNDAFIFLDEPELSLHLDYQRLILQFLTVQGTPKQFFVATHSPFIYAKYPNSVINLEEKTNDPESESTRNSE